MKTFVCIALLLACALAAPAPGLGARDKRSYWAHGAGGLAYSGYSLDAPFVSHAPLVYSAPAAVIHEPAIVSVKKIVSVPQVVSVKKIVSYPHVSRAAHYVSYPHVSRAAHYVSYPHVSRAAHYVSYPHVSRVAHYVAAPRVSYSYAPSYSAGWW